MELGSILKYKFPNVKFEVRDDSNGEGAYIASFDGTMPTEEELTVYEAEYNDYKASILYIEQRKSEYPSIEDQLDMQYHDGINGTTTWKDAIDAVKLKYPKS
jgi:hypothetical protein